MCPKRWRCSETKKRNAGCIISCTANQILVLWTYSIEKRETGAVNKPGSNLKVSKRVEANMAVRRLRMRIKPPWWNLIPIGYLVASSPSLTHSVCEWETWFLERAFPCAVFIVIRKWKTFYSMRRFRASDWEFPDCKTKFAPGMVLYFAWPVLWFCEGSANVPIAKASVLPLRA